MDLTDSRAWSRLHANGMDALVFEVPGSTDHYAAGAIPSGTMGFMGTVRGPLDRAQRAADLASGCPQPCTSPP